MTSPEPTPKASIADRLERINEIWYQPIMDSIIADLRAQEKALQEAKQSEVYAVINAFEDVRRRSSLHTTKDGDTHYHVSDNLLDSIIAEIGTRLTPATPKVPEGTKL